MREGELVSEPNPNYKYFHSKPNISLDDYTISYQWNQLKKEIKKVDLGNQRYYCTLSSDKPQELTTQDYIDFITKDSWDSYDDFKTHSKQIRYMTLNAECWELSTCSCFKWSKDYVCKHMLSLCYRKKCFDYPIEAKNVMIGENRKRGRPKKTASALTFQDQECVQEFVMSDTESESEEPKKQTKKRKATQDSDSDYDLFEEEIAPVVPPKIIRKSIRKKSKNQ